MEQQTHCRIIETQDLARVHRWLDAGYLVRANQKWVTDETLHMYPQETTFHVETQGEEAP